MRGGSERRYGTEVSATLVEMYRAGMTRPEIVAATGISRETVLRRLHEAGVDLRAKNLRPQTVRVPTDPSKIGYLAGLIDGEGNVQLRNGRRNVGGKLAIYSTTVDVMAWLVDNVGGRVRWDVEPREAKGWLPIGIWEIYRARDVAAVLAAVEPLLIVKRDVARELLELYAHRGISVH